MERLSEFAKNIQKKSPIFDYYPPKNNYIGIISIPHSGLDIPDEFQQFLVQDKISIKQDVDFFVHELVDIPTLQAAGIAVIKANIIRTAVDLNREKESAVLNWKKNSKGHLVVQKEASPNEVNDLIEKYYSPYFEMMKALINELNAHMARPSIIDLHSMPSKATEYHLKINPDQKVNRPSFCVSDRSGLTCEKSFIDSICNSLSKYYPNTTQNDPYFGGYITQHIQNHFPKTNNIQIEINRALYMDEANFELLDSSSDLKKQLTQMIIENFNHFFNS